MLRSIPLGLHQLWHQKLRLFSATLGITFAVILVSMQREFNEALYISAVRYHEAMDYDLVMLSPKTEHLFGAQNFPRNRLFQTRSFDGVAAVTPIYQGSATWRNPADPTQRRGIFVMGFDPVDRGFDHILSPQALLALEIPYQVVFDRLGRPEFGPVADLLASQGKASVEINDRNFSVVDLYGIGSSFAIDGSVMTSDLNFKRIFPDHAKSAIQLGLIHLAPGADPEAVRRAIQGGIPQDVRVLTRAEFSELEINHWRTATAIGLVFGFGVIMGLVVGAIIVYQILFSDVQDHLKEYATLLAMGYSHSYLKVVVLQEAVVLAVLGFIPGMLISNLLFDLTAKATHLPLELSTRNAADVFGLTLGMCAVSGLLAVRKLSKADPAEVF